MQILEDSLYILMEGEPDSPEIAFMNRAINKLIVKGFLPDINYEIVEIGGSGNFNSIAGIIYKKSKLHKSIPVLAITDRDFRNPEDIKKRAKTPEQLINNKNVKFIYWTRHEWENFLLEETEQIIDLINQISTIPNSKKPFKINSISLQKQQLDGWLLDYLKSSINREFMECLKFRFREGASMRPQLEKPDNNDLINLSTTKDWFVRQILQQSNICKEKIENLEVIFDGILTELDWENWIQYPERLNFESAKIHFSGKEAFRALFSKITNELSMQNLSENKFIQEMLLPELENNINSRIVREIEKLLLPWFLGAYRL